MNALAERLDVEMSRALADAPASHVEAALALLLELRGHDPAGDLVRGAEARELARAVSPRRGLLALTTGSGRVVYPAFQFDGHGVVAGLAEVLDLLPADLVSHWTVASWLVSDDPDLEASPIALLAAGRQRLVVEAATRWATALEA